MDDKKGNRSGYTREKTACLPPFFKADEAVVVQVNLIKEASNSAFWYSQAGFSEGCF